MSKYLLSLSLLGLTFGVNAMDSDSSSAASLSSYAKLEKEVRFGCLSAVRQLLQEHPYMDVNVLNSCGITALMVAVILGDEDMVHLLLRAKDINVNKQGQWGRTALHWAIEWGRKDMVELLLEQPGIDLDIQDDDGRTALVVALSDKNACAWYDYRDKKIAVTLLRKGPRSEAMQAIVVARQPMMELRQRKKSRPSENEGPY